MMRAARPASLQARLLTLLLGLVTVVWLGAATLTWRGAQHELDELLDGHLAQAAALLVVQQSHTEDDEVADAPTLHKYAPKVMFQVFHEGQLVQRSANAALTPMATQTRGFVTVRLNDGASWRIFATRGAESDVQVFVGEQTASRRSILWAVLRGVLLPLLLTLPLLALAGWWAVRQGLAPLRQLGQLLGQRQAQALAPVELANMPSEMQPMVQALNALFERIEQLLTAERRFTADAAHELRTPIAAIRTQAQVALGAGDDTAQRQHALQFTLAGCDRATRLVEQMLTLARLEASPGATPSTPVDLCAVARRVAAELALAALARQQTLALEADVPCPVAGDEALLGVLVRNLIDNALRYSPDGAQILVQLEQAHGQATLQVHDSGPGMTDAEMARLGERFFRVLGQSQPGSGLGWSIVQRIAKVLGAGLQVSRSELLGGLAVKVHWPAP
jgi:two-component system sensor histidine kinase QseC